MIVLIALPTLIIYVVVLGLAIGHLRDAATAEVEGEMTQLADSYAGRFDGAFREVAAIAATTARFLETEPDLAEEKIYQQLRANTLQNPIVYGAAVAFEPGTYRRGDELFCPYVYRGADGLAEMNISRERPTRVRKPSSSRVARSPVRSQPSRRVSAVASGRCQ